MTKPVEVRVCKSPGCSMEAAPRRQLCIEDWTAKQPPVIRTEAALRRLSLIPEPYRLARVPEKDWPHGRRWCAGCQTFVRLQDCGAKASRCKACVSAASHASRIKSGFGIDQETYQWLMDKQLGKCGICRASPRTTRFALDHDHKHCKRGCPVCVRGLLCSKCNHELLGAAHDSINILRNAIAYLERPPMQGEWDIPEWERQEWEAEYGDSEPAPY